MLVCWTHGIVGRDDARDAPRCLQNRATPVNQNSYVLRGKYRVGLGRTTFAIQGET